VTKTDFSFPTKFFSQYSLLIGKDRRFRLRLCAELTSSYSVFLELNHTRWSPGIALRCLNYVVCNIERYLDGHKSSIAMRTTWNALHIMTHLDLHYSIPIYKLLIWSNTFSNFQLPFGKIVSTDKRHFRL